MRYAQRVGDGSRAKVLTSQDNCCRVVFLSVIPATGLRRPEIFVSHDMTNRWLFWNLHRRLSALAFVGCFDLRDVIERERMIGVNLGGSDQIDLVLRQSSDRH